MDSQKDMFDLPYAAYLRESLGTSVLARKLSPRLRAKMKISVGQWVRTRWDDSGALDGIVVEKCGKDLKVFFPATQSMISTDLSQVIAAGKRIVATDTGL